MDNVRNVLVRCSNRLRRRIISWINSFISNIPPWILKIRNGINLNKVNVTNRLITNANREHIETIRNIKNILNTHSNIIINRKSKINLARSNC